MPTNQEDTNNRLIIKQILQVILSLSLFLGGIALLFSRIPGWSLLFGVITIPIGLAFIIFTLDNVSRNLVTPPELKLTRCNVCGKQTYLAAKEDPGETICNHCRKELGRKITQKS